MNIIVCTSSQPLQTILAHKLIPHGINLIQMNKPDEIFASVPKRGNICLIDDNQLDQRELFKMIVDMKKDETKKGARIVLITKTSDQNLIKSFTKIGIDLVLQSSLHMDTIAEKFLSFLQQFSEQHAQRKFIRIKIDSNEDATVRFLLPANKSYVEGKITDISMGGIAAKFTANDINLLAEAIVYSSCQMNLGKKSILADLKLVKKGTEIAAFSIEKIRDTFKDSLAEYIYQKIQKNLDSISS